MSSKEVKKPNRLIEEKSPYLLQHAYNPVDWYPWKEEAFKKAAEEDKPIFLSIGYSTCHWCHVMEKESFEDEEIAAILNDNFVAIKVDREERPDIDSLYMKVCMAMTGSGGWPLTILLTPDKKSFFAGTYFPKETRYGRIGLKDFLSQIVTAWKNDRERMLETSEVVFQRLKNLIRRTGGGEFSREILDRANEGLERSFDPGNGGFGSRPKFPAPHNFLFLLRYWKKTGKDSALRMVETSLEKMGLGGIYDHIGFGFHRYSTDESWFLPHFEKMLYDQAMMGMAYTEAYQATKNEFYRNLAEEVFGYVLRDMQDEKGGFYSAEDADSEGKEGKFYVWSIQEIEELLQEDADIFNKIYNVEENGNYREEATGRITGENIIYLEKSIDETAQDLGFPYEELKQKIRSMRERLFRTRRNRVHPLKDDKVLTDWNGLMIAALSKGARVFSDEKYAEAAMKTADFLIETMKSEDGRLFHRYRDGEVLPTAYLDDYAFLIWGLIEMYQTTFVARYLKEAVRLQEYALNHFWDGKDGGFYLTPNDCEEKAILRLKEVYDGAYPSGNSVMLYNLARLSRLSGNLKYEESAFEMAKTFNSDVNASPTTYTMFLCGLDFLIGESTEIVIVGELEDKGTKEFVKAINEEYIPNKVLLLKSRDSAIDRIAEYTQELRKLDQKTTVYICRNFTCQLPITSKEDFISQIRESARG